MTTRGRSTKAKGTPPPVKVPCSAYRLPPETSDETVIANAIDCNPQNGMWLAASASIALMSPAPDPPGRIAVMMQKLWDKATAARLPTAFLSGSAELKRKALWFLNQTNGGGAVGVEFVEASVSNSLIRVDFDSRDGHYSYLGSDCRLIPKNQKTMNLALSLSSPESEWWRVVPHEGFHAEGCPHEHARQEIVALLDPAGCYAEFREYGWDREMVDQQILTPLDQRSIMGSPANVNSAMCYQFSARCTKNRKPIPGGLKPTADDIAFMTKIYPGAVAPPPPPPPVETGKYRGVIEFDVNTKTFRVVQQ